jgi:DegV family protein with EDD domain
LWYSEHYADVRENDVTIKIVTDSTCDLPDELAAEHGISVVPLYINIGTESYLDGIELSRRAFYEGLPDYKTFPTTAVPGVGAFKRVYERLANEGATEILSLHISISLSSVVNVARLAAEEVKSVRVTVLDSRQLSLGTGWLAMLAAKAAAARHSMEDILEQVKDQIRRSYVFAALDTLEFLRRSGRMNGIVAGLGTLIDLKPLLKMYDGQPTSERVRTNGRAYRRLIELVSAIGPLERLALVHTNAPDKAEQLRQQAQPLFPGDEEPLSVNVTSVIGSHIGPGAVGFAAVASR